KGIVEIAENAAMVVTDRGYTRLQKEWRKEAGKKIKCPLIQVETDVIVPVEEASSKEEYAARTLRPRIHKLLNKYMQPLEKRELRKSSLGINLEIEELDLSEPDKVLNNLGLINRLPGRFDYHGGINEARGYLFNFIQNRLDLYPEWKNNPAIDGLSNMSPYLHFGQVSPLYIALKVEETGSPGAETYLEELIVRRELAINFVHFNPFYDEFQSLPDWCRKTLEEHTKDRREYTYSFDELERGKTHDKYWNAAQDQMVYSGKMHGYMRMYWGKKIIEWTENPREAYEIALELNNRYELDGRGPNGFAGVAWCFGKHDQPWKEREIFGKIRYMNDRGLKRKFDADTYVNQVEKTVSSLKKNV
ncbi:MAG: deoxyribodipyrimidine photo-lyase, partial [Vulcanimicrobiota bacterium]